MIEVGQADLEALLLHACPLNPLSVHQQHQCFTAEISAGTLALHNGNDNGDYAQAGK